MKNDAPETERSSKLRIAAFAVLHLLCCGIPLLLLSGVSLAFLLPTLPIAGTILAVLGVVGFIWYLKRGCATCPRNEGRCRDGVVCATDNAKRKGNSEREVKIRQ
jgi:hypothetical protein